MKTRLEGRFGFCCKYAVALGYSGGRRMIARLGAIALVAAVGSEAQARVDDVPDLPGRPKNEQARRPEQKIGPSRRLALPTGLPATPHKFSTPPPSRSAADLDKVYGIKGWNIRFPSFGDTLTQDVGGWRSSLASAGFGAIEFNITWLQANMLDNARAGPNSNRFYL